MLDQIIYHIPRHLKQGDSACVVFLSACPSLHDSSIHSVAAAVLDGLFPYLVYVIMSMGSDIIHNEFCLVYIIAKS